MQQGPAMVRVCDFTPHDNSSHDTFSLYPNCNSAMAVYCVKIREHEMKCREVNRPGPYVTGDLTDTRGLEHPAIS